MPYTPTVTVNGTTPPGPVPGHFGDIAGGSVGQKYVSALDYYEPYELVEIYARHSLKPNFVDWIGVYGNETTSSNPKVGQYEKGPTEAYLRFGSVDTAAVGAGNDIVMVVDATLMRDDSLATGGAARKSSPGRVGEQILVGSNAVARIKSKDITADPHTITLTPIDATVDLDTAVLADTNYAIINNAHGEGTGGMTGAIPQLIKYSNDFQIVKEAVGATGSSATNKLRFNPVKNMPGSFFMLANWETMNRFSNRKSGALLMGQPGSNVTVVSDQTGYDVTVTQTEGLEHFARTGGFNATFTSGSLVLDDLRAIARYLEVYQIGAGEVCAWLGYDVYEGLEKAAATFLDANADAYVMRNMISSRITYTNADEGMFDGDALALNLGFRSVHLGGTRFSWYLLHEFNSATGLGMSTYDYTETGIFHPMTNTTNYLTGSPDPIVGVVYKELNGYSRKNVISQIAGAGVGGQGGYTPLANHDVDGLNIYFTSELAFHATTANRFIYFSPA